MESTGGIPQPVGCRQDLYSTFNLVAAASCNSLRCAGSPPLDNDMAPIKLLVVDDHDFFRRSIMPPLEMETGFEILGTANSGEQAVDLCHSLRPDVVLMDLNMPYLSGLAAMQRLGPRQGALAILVLTGVDDPQSVGQAFAAGARGYLRKDMITDDLLVSAILTVASGGFFMDAQTFALLKHSFLFSQPRLTDERLRQAHLTPDESALLRCVSLGYDNDEIGQQLQITSKTVSNRLSQIYARLGVGNRVQAATFALRSGLVDLKETGNL